MLTPGPVPDRPSSARLWTCRVLGAVFVAAGVLHFLRPDAYVRIMPPYLPAPRALVFASGAAEIAGGLGLWFGRLRPAAAWGLAALLVAVLPANVEMARRPALAPGIPAWALWARLALQPLLIALVLWAGRQTRRTFRR